MRKSKPKKRILLPDPKYNDTLVTRFVNNIMLKGEKSIAYDIFYDAINKVEIKKTSTGFHPAGGAKVEDVTLMKQEGQPCRIKASGGIRTAQDALAMIEAGADRLGCSASVAIVRQFMSMARQP